MNKPIVSVIIPTYNRKDLLERAIKSVLSQTFQDWELIIVDDGSTDETRDLVENFQRVDPRIKYIWQNNSGAPAKPRNVGILNSSGEYIAFLDHDDEWLPIKLEKQLIMLESLPEVAFVSCNVIVLSPKKNEFIVSPKYKGEKFVKKILEKNLILTASSVVIKRWVFEKVGLFDENFKFADDWDMWLRIALKYNFDFVDKPLVKYYWHGENRMIRTKIGERIRDYEYFVYKHWSILEKFPKAFDVNLRYLGLLNMQCGNVEKARHYFKIVLTKYPWSLRTLVNLVLSYIGKDLYNFALNFKRKVENFINKDKLT